MTPLVLVFAALLSVVPIHKAESGGQTDVSSTARSILERLSTTASSSAVDWIPQSRSEMCSCKYPVVDGNVIAQSDGKRLIYGDKVRNGSTVEFRCQRIGYHRFKGHRNITCIGCKPWHSSDFPNCTDPKRGDPVILLNKAYNVLMDGSIEIPKGQSANFTCVAVESGKYPKWTAPVSPGVSVTRKTILRGDVEYVTYLHILNADYENEGTYECSNEGNHQSSVIRILITETVVGTISTTPMGNTSPESEASQNENGGSTNPQNTNFQDNRECFCTYDYPYTSQVKAKSGLEILKLGDKIPRGRTVTLECKIRYQIFEWPSGLRSYGTASMTCSACNRWLRGDLPTCRNASVDDVIIAFQEGLTISPGGVVDLTKGEHRLFHCISKNIQPQWSFGVQRNVIVTQRYNLRPDGTIYYITELDLKGAEDLHAGRYECYTQRRGQLISKAILDLRVNATGIRCPAIDGGEDFSVYYNYERRINSTANFMCRGNNKRVDGCSLMTCLPSGEWTRCNPTCVDFIPTSCPRFPLTPFLLVDYSRRRSIGSVATFSCSSSSKVLVGSSKSSCLNNFTWSNPPASCEDPRCYLGDLVTPEDVEPDVTDMIEEFIPYGSEVKLRCKHNSIMSGNSKAVCKERGSWELGSYQCVNGCVLTIDPSSHLVAQPRKDSYRFGEFVRLSCLKGEKMSAPVERVMCMADSWSDPLPDCEELEEGGDVSCPKFLGSPGLEVTYSKNMSVGSIAKFSCLPSTRNLVGNPVSTCQENGSWSSHLPSCEDTKCSIRDLLKSISEDVELDMTDMTGDFKAHSVVRLKCRDHSVINGNSNVVCGEDGKWKLGYYQCALGCVLNIDSSSHLLAHPVKDSYRFGEFVVLKCARGYLLTENVERIMCLGSTWSNSLPSCKPWRQRD